MAERGSTAEAGGTGGARGERPQCQARCNCLLYLPFLRSQCRSPCLVRLLPPLPRCGPHLLPLPPFLRLLCFFAASPHLAHCPFAPVVVLPAGLPLSFLALLVPFCGFPPCLPPRSCAFSRLSAGSLVASLRPPREDLPDVARRGRSGKERGDLRPAALDPRLGVTVGTGASRIYLARAWAYRIGPDMTPGKSGSL